MNSGNVEIILKLRDMFSKPLVTISAQTTKAATSINAQFAKMGDNAARSMQKATQSAYVAQNSFERLLQVTWRIRDSFDAFGAKAVSIGRRVGMAFAGMVNSVRRSGMAFQNFFQSIQRNWLMVLAFIGSLRVLGRFIGEITDAANEQIVAETRLAAVFKSKGLEVEENVRQIRDYASALQLQLGVGDEVVISVGAQIAALTGLSGAPLKDAIKASLSLATIWKMDLANAGKLVAKTLASDTNALMRQGIQLEKGLTMTEKLAAILPKLAAGYQMALAQATTFAGKQTILNAQWGELKEALGNFIVTSPFINQALSNISASLNAMSIALGSPEAKAAWAKMEADAISFGASFAQSIQPIIDVFRQMMPTLAGIWKGMFPTLKVLTIAGWKLIVRVVTDALQVLNDLLNIVLAVMKGDWKGAWAALKDIAVVLWKGIVDILKVVWKGLVAASKEIWFTLSTAIIGTWLTIRASAIDAWNGIVNTIRSKMQEAASVVRNYLNDMKNAWTEWGLSLVGNSIVPDIHDAIVRDIKRFGLEGSKAYKDYLKNVKEETATGMNDLAAMIIAKYKEHPELAFLSAGYNVLTGKTGIDVASEFAKQIPSQLQLLSGMEGIPLGEPRPVSPLVGTFRNESENLLPGIEFEQLMKVYSETKDSVIAFTESFLEAGHAAGLLFNDMREPIEQLQDGLISLTEASKQAVEILNSIGKPTGGTTAIKGLRERIQTPEFGAQLGGAILGGQDAMGSLVGGLAGDFVTTGLAGATGGVLGSMMGSLGAFAGPAGAMIGTLVGGLIESWVGGGKSKLAEAKAAPVDVNIVNLKDLTLAILQANRRERIAGAGAGVRARDMDISRQAVRLGYGY